MRAAPGWRVAVEAHEVGRWSIEATVVEVRAINEVQARRVGVPPWRPLLRRLYVRCRVVERLNEQADDELGGSVRVRITEKSIDHAAPSPPANSVAAPGNAPPQTPSPREEQHGR